MAMRLSAGRSAVGIAALVSVLLAASTGCSSGSGDGGGGGEDGSPLLAALGALSGDAGAKSVTYLDAARVRELSKDDAKRFSTVSRTASTLLNSYEPSQLGAEFKKSDIETAVDTPEAGRWTGTFDEKAITEALESGGYARSGHDGREVWSRQTGTGASFRVSKDEISYSTEGSGSMAAVDPRSGSSLADDKDFRRAAECPGDVYRAAFVPVSSPGAVRLAASGQQAPSATENTEILCFVTKDEAAAASLEKELREVVSAEAPTFDGTKVTVEKGDRPVVRAGVPDSATQRPGRLIVSDLELWMAAVKHGRRQPQGRHAAVPYSRGAR
ncbi:hypothetical protein GA0115245_143618 [Streptomyces sp. di188]|nr:hypothetical protein GA0115238_107234 [Streptomyces sp. di50b]SCE47183.1 hypothetical protein GA0115245_143618 [Streptomyces sp. di188]